MVRLSYIKEDTLAYIYTLRCIHTHIYTISTQTDLSTFSKFVKERNDAVFVGEFRSPPRTTLAFS